MGHSSHRVRLEFEGLIRGEHGDLVLLDCLLLCWAVAAWVTTSSTMSASSPARLAFHDRPTRADSRAKTQEVKGSIKGIWLLKENSLKAKRSQPLDLGRLFDLGANRLSREWGARSAYSKLTNRAVRVALCSRWPSRQTRSSHKAHWRRRR